MFFKCRPQGESFGTMAVLYSNDPEALSAWFTFGGLGVPAQGAAGCAWATLAVYVGLMLAALALLRGRPLYAPYAI